MGYEAWGNFEPLDGVYAEFAEVLGTSCWVLPLDCARDDNFVFI
jgi:hypothetical protein